MPGDVEVGDLLLVEAKMTRTGSINIKPSWIEKIKNQSKQAGKKQWCLEAWVAEGNGNFIKTVTIDKDFFMELLSENNR